MKAIETTELCKLYGDIAAVKSISVEVEKGAVVGLVGPNGAGKTTLLNMMSGLLEPSSGTVRIHGSTYMEDGDRIRAMTGVMQDFPGLFEDLSGREHLTFVGQAYGIERSKVIERSDELMRLFELEGAGRRYVHSYSSGMKKKLALASALLHKPKLLLLDEPFSSLDPSTAAIVERTLALLSSRGVTVVLSSHSLERVHRLCSEVLLLNSGDRVLYERSGRGETLSGNYRGKTLEDVYLELVGDASEKDLSWL